MNSVLRASYVSWFVFAHTPYNRYKRRGVSQTLPKCLSHQGRATFLPHCVPFLHWWEKGLGIEGERTMLESLSLSSTYFYLKSSSLCASALNPFSHCPYSLLLSLLAVTVFTNLILTKKRNKNFFLPVFYHPLTCFYLSLASFTHRFLFTNS